MMKIGTKHIVYFAVTGFFIVFLIVGNIVASIFSSMITTFLHGTGVSFEGEEVAAAQAQGDELVQRIMGEGIVLFKNDKNALPLKANEKNLNLMGWSSSNGGFLLKGNGSGSSTIRDDARVFLTDALKDEGFVLNDGLQALYTGNRNYASYSLQDEPAMSVYTQPILASAKAHSKVAIVVIGRTGGEGINGLPEIPKAHTDGSGRAYLQTSDREEELITLAANNFDKVIVIVNTANFMHMDFLNDDRVDAALFVGLAGQSGTRAIAQVLNGKITPSGRVSDIIAYPTYDSTWQNATPNGSHFVYSENIYYGYKWYETANEEGVFDNVTNNYGTGYKAVVQFPFGYGKSYTSFEWSDVVSSIPNGGKLLKDSEVTVTLSVMNSGTTYSGREVIQLYSTPPYKPGGVEKAHVNLIDFAKTTVLDPGDKQTEIELTFSAYDLASYDAYNKSGLVPNGGYVLEAGEYKIKLMNNSHEVNECEGATITLTVDESIVFDKDPVTEKEVKNRWTGASAYAGVPIDASTVGAPTYLSRKDKFANRNAAVGARPTNPSGSLVTQANNYSNNSFNQTSMPAFNSMAKQHRIVQAKGPDGDIVNLATTGNSRDRDFVLPQGYEFQFNQELIDKLLNYDDDLVWGELLDQLKPENVKSFVELAGFRTHCLEEIGLPRLYDFDGPAGFNTKIQGTEGEWTAYTSETLIGCTFSKEVALIFGLAQGSEAAATGISGWYAPGVNIHRTPYSGRNFEYYSEDAVLSGKMAAMTILGAKANGLSCFIKHFVAHESGPNYRGNVWMTEQNLRENYLKPFEIAVKEGKGNAIMTAFNAVGGTWAGASNALNNEVLRGEWGFKGAIITDWTDGKNGIYGDTKQGLRGGNDIWLAPGANSSTISTSDATDMFLAKRSVKNVAYMYIDTMNFQKTFDFEGELAKYKAEIGIRTITPPFPLWIPLLAVGEFLAALGIAAWGVFGVFALHKRKKATVVTATAAGGTVEISPVSAAEAAPVFERPAVEAVPEESAPNAESESEPLAEKPKTGKTKKPKADDPGAAE